MSKRVNGKQVIEWNIGTLLQGMRMKGEDGPVVINTPAGETQVFDRDWVVMGPDGACGVIRRGTAQTMGW